MNSFRIVLGILAIACLGFASFSGCGQPTVTESDAAKKPLPKMDFHKPASFSAAVSRIREIHDTLLSEDGLPASISYTVKEVSHSHGDGDAHIHYHLAGEIGEHNHENCDHDHGDHDHDHADPFQPTHRVTIDIFTELKDIAKWLPAIASDGDLARESWNTAKVVSEKITSHLVKVAASDLPLIQRTTYQGDSTEMEKWIQDLESLVKPESLSSEN